MHNAARVANPTRSRRLSPRIAYTERDRVAGFDPSDGEGIADIAGADYSELHESLRCRRLFGVSRNAQKLASAS